MPQRVHVADKACLKCEKVFNRKVMPSGRLESLKDYGERKFCSHQCYANWHQGENHSLFNPEGSQRDDGYIRIAVNGRRTYLHRYLMEQKLGRRLNKEEHVHHLDGDNENNTLENLSLTNNPEHRKLHSKIQKRDSHGKFTKEEGCNC